MNRILAAERTRLGLTQGALAERIGVSRGLIQKWEAAGNLGKASGSQLQALSDLFSVSTDYLLGRTTERKAS